MTSTTAARARRRLAGATAASGAVIASTVLASLPAQAAASPVVTRASVATGGVQLDGSSTPSVRGALSADGHRVAFDRAGRAYVHDLTTNRTYLASVNSKGTKANAAVGNASLSADGRFVVFESTATNLGGEHDVDKKDTVDVFRHNIETGKTVRVSVGRKGAQPNGNNFFPVVSGNGRYVAFQSDSSNLVKKDTNGHEDVFVRNLKNGKTTRVSRNVHDKEFPGISLEPSISKNGRWVLFAMTKDGDGLADLFLRDRDAGTTTRVFSEARYDHAVVGAWNVSSNGRYAVFQTDGALVADDTNGDFDIYRMDLRTHAVLRASVDSNGGQRAGVSGRGAISGDGTRVAFSTQSAGYTSDDGGATSDVFVRDLVAGTTVKVSVTPGGKQANDHSGFQGYLALSDDGRSVSFESGATDLVTGDTNRAPDTFVARIE